MAAPNAPRLQPTPCPPPVQREVRVSSAWKLQACRGPIERRAALRSIELWAPSVHGNSNSRRPGKAVGYTRSVPCHVNPINRHPSGQRRSFKQARPERRLRAWNGCKPTINSRVKHPHREAPSEHPYLFLLTAIARVQRELPRSI